MGTSFKELLSKSEFLAVGLMSGTSMDGIDTTLVQMSAAAESPALELIAFKTYPYPDELQMSLKELASGERCTAEDIASLHTGVAVSFANSFFSLCRETGVGPNTVDFIGSHGQTVAHVPPSGEAGHEVSGTLQLGPPGMIAALTGVTTVGDFRVGDIALGGQGAPLAPYVDFLIRRSRSANRIILNIGGIANVTYLPKDGGAEAVIAFDTGPGNMILDELYRVLYPKEKGFDGMDDALRRGKASESFIDRFMSFSYFKKEPPKSAGHHEFGSPFAWEFLSQAQGQGMKKEDIMATALALTARSIGDAVEEFITPHGGVDEVFVSGGGSRNAVMVEELRRVLEPTDVRLIDELGIPAEAKEAVDFAVLARETILMRENVIPGATGAAKALVLGTIAPGRPM